MVRTLRAKYPASSYALASVLGLTFAAGIRRRAPGTARSLSVARSRLTGLCHQHGGRGDRGGGGREPGPSDQPADLALAENLIRPGQSPCAVIFVPLDAEADAVLRRR